jgi:chromosome segregation ATPase
MIERIVGKQREWQAARVADFRAVVAQIADGNEPDADIVTQVLHEAGKSLDDLQQAVELLQRRRELRRKLDSVPRLMAERREIERQIAAANRDLDAAEKRHQELVYPLQGRLEELSSQTYEGEQARGELQRTCADPDLLARQADVTGKLQGARQEASDMRAAIHNYRTWAENDRQRAVGAFQGDAKERIDRAESREQRANRIEKELPAVEKTIAALEREEASIREQMLVP